MSPREKAPGWLSRITKRSGSNVTGQEDTAKAAHERRREQIRRAQRTHRERKEHYIKNLEAEVVKLREKDAFHNQVVNGYKRKIGDLNQLLIAHGITIPPELLHIESPQAAIAVQLQSDGQQNLRATMPSLQSAQSQGSEPSAYNQTMSPSAGLTSAGTASTSEMSDLAENYHSMGFTGQGPQQKNDPGSNRSSRGHPNDLDSAQIAVDFVLDLERPCLTHHGPNLHDGEFNGHKLMVQAPIMAHSSTPGSIYNTAPGGKLPMNATWNVPAFEVDRLLNLSTRLSLDGEITPIEAWQRVKQHPGFVTMDLARLNSFKAVLLPEVQCYGFGAVIDEEYFNFLLEQHLASGVTYT